MPKSLWLKLVLPLALVALVSLLVHQWWDPGGFLINLTTELIGIVVTVVYVDWVLRRHEAERWKGTDERIQERLTKFVFFAAAPFDHGPGIGVGRMGPRSGAAHNGWRYQPRTSRESKSG